MKAIWILLFTAIPVAAHATTVERLTLDDLARKSEKIVIGKVNRARTYWSGKIILTTYAVDVQETIKGPGSRTVEVTTIGGTVGDITLHVEGMPLFEAGEDSIIFLETTGAFSTVVGLGQGKFAIRDGEVANSVDDLRFTDGHPGRPLTMPLEAFKAQIKRRLHQ